MTNEDQADLRVARNWFLTLLIAIMLLGGAATIVSRAFDLSWFPWEVKMKTGMIRASNGYVTTQQAALRQFRIGYEQAETDGQRNAILAQMKGIADTIPGDVPSDIKTFLVAGDR